jgi:hypothetical protein
MKQKYLIILSISISISICLTVFWSDKVSASTITQAQFEKSILNGISCVPNQSHGYQSIKMIKGEHKSKDRQTEIEKIVCGKLDGKQVAVAFITDWTGGSGIFDSLLLYEERNGRATTVGSYGFGDRAEVSYLTIINNKIKLVSRETVPYLSSTSVRWIKFSDFDKAECIQSVLTGKYKEDVDFMLSLYEDAFWKKAFTLEDKKKAFEICNRHKSDRASFTNCVRLKIEENGFDPGPRPLQYDQAGKPVIYIDSKQRFDL